MTNQSADDQLVGSYLHQLEYSLRFVRPELRNDFVKEIGAHIATERESDIDVEETSVDAILSRLGEPQVLARGIQAIDRSQNRRDNPLRRFLRFVGRFRLRIVIVALVALSVCVQQYVAHYAPLAVMEGGNGGARIVYDHGRLARSVDDSYANFQTLFSPSAKNYTLEFFASISNPGPWGIRIDYVGLDDQTESVFDSKSYFSNGSWKAPIRSSPKILPSKGYQVFLIRVPRTCSLDPGSYITFTRFSVEYEYLGFHHWLWVQLPRPFAVVAPKTCPES